MTYEIPSVKILQQLQMKQWLTTSSKLFMTIHVHHPSVLTPFPSPLDTYSCNIIQFRYVNIIHFKVTESQSKRTITYMYIYK